ncbi:MAG TPA: hypothetical protein VHU40_06665 [Polyangia bacterium]|nr:hypothetical protein [Polyangia bacterium]
MPPSPSTTDTIVRGQSVTFTVYVSDPDQDHLDITWAAKIGPCLDRREPSNWPKDASPSSDPSPFTFTVSGDLTDGRFCVWAIATDAHGATNANNTMIDPSNPANRPPTALITLDDPKVATSYPLYTKFRLVGSGEDPDGDRDPITKYSWQPLQAPSSDATLGLCNDGTDDDTVRCFTANTPGDYTASLKVSSQAPFQSNADESQAYTKTFRVLEDAPPCIVGTTPQYTTLTVPRNSATAWTFSVDTVTDDGDPLPSNGDPNGRLTFIWSYGKKGEPLTVLNGNINLFKIKAGQYDPLDVSVIRVEVLDRRPETLTSLQMCDKDFCEAKPGSGCFQRVTWTVSWQ